MPAAAQETQDVEEPTQAEAEIIDEETEEHDESHFPLKKPPLLDWSFSGVFGKYDAAQLQRGLQVYREVCAACHGLEYVAFRNLGEPGGLGYSEEQVRAFAAEYELTDGPDEFGDMFERPAIPSDRFPSPFPNDNAAASANGGAFPPDLSLIAKARAAERGPIWTVVDFFTQYQEAGPNYVTALLIGYDEQPPAGVDIPEGTHYNPYFLSGAAIAMPAPLFDEMITYSDGSPETVLQYSRDVSAFLMWAAEPHLAPRKQLGFNVGIFLLIFAVLMYLTKKRVWARVAH
ncbi:MAG: cytochrome c1 [Hyphomicrobiales bacterium]|nr:cytochrome c1 [Hyphomicrobiales bacterium]